MDNKVTKRQFIDKLSRRLNCEYDEAAIICKQFLDLIIEELLAGNKIIFNGFGSFEIKTHKGHKIIYGKNKSCKDYYVLTFSASNIIRRKINKPKD